MQDNFTDLILDNQKVPGYTIDTQGNIYCKRLKRYLVKHKRSPPHNYEMVCLRINNMQVKRRVHVLLMHTFKGPKPFPELFVDHIDRDPTNNSLDNLRWVTRQINNMNRASRGYETRGTSYRVFRLMSDFPSTVTYHTPEEAHAEYLRRHDIKFTRLLKELDERIRASHYQVQ